MPPRTTDTRKRMLDAAADLLSQQGTAGTTVEAVLARSGAPRGSVYHHFPAGRNEIVIDAVAMVGERVGGAIEASAGREPAEVLGSFVTFWRRQLVRSDYRAGCPVVALAVGGVEHVPGGDELVAGVLEAWRATFVRALTQRGLGPDRARRLANLILSATQGAVVLCRAQRSTEPLDDVVAELTAILVETA